MTEGIDFNDDGTITVRFDGQTWTLGRPKFSHWRKYSREFTRSAEATVAEYQRLVNAVKDLEDSDDDDARYAAEEQLRDYNDNSILDERIRILRDIFAELADRPLPADVDDWPPWLILSPPNEVDADGKLVAQPAVAARIVGHWRNVPKVSSKPPAD
jgi:hypothetical protein